MARITVSVVVSAPVAAVWSHLQRVEDHAEWMSDAVSLEFLSDRRRGVGTRYRVATKVGPFRTADVMEITAWEPRSAIEVAHRGAVSGRGRIGLDAHPAGTRVVWDERLRFPWHLGGPVGALAARPILRRIWKANLLGLKERIERDLRPA